jgi:hypothetical protein
MPAIDYAYRVGDGLEFDYKLSILYYLKAFLHGHAYNLRLE